MAHGNSRRRKGVFFIDTVKEHEQTEANGQVVFTLGEEKYGIEIACVKEIMKWAKPTELPQMPDAISGVIKLRDQVIPLFSPLIGLDNNLSSVII